MNHRIIGQAWRACALAAIILPGLAGTSAALAAAGAPGSGGPSESLFITQVVLLVIVGRLLGEFMHRIGQPSIMGQIIGGVLLGPTVLGALWPEAHDTIFGGGPAQNAMIDGLSQLGILFLLLLAGMETDLNLAKRMRKLAAGVSISGIVIPFAFGFMLGEWMPADLLPHPDRRLVTSLFLGTALAISSVKIVATVVREMDFMRRNIGQLIVASAIIDDTIGWVIIAVTFSIASSGSVDMMTLAKSVLGTLAFLAVSFTVGQRLVFFIIRWTNDTFQSELPVLSAIIGIMGLMAVVTHLIGVHTVLGAFVAGILVGQSPILTRQIDEQLRALTTALFMPVFFGLTGLHTDLRVLGNGETLLLAGALIAIASLGKFSGAFLGGRFGGLTRAESMALGCGMNARGSTEVIVASIGLAVGVLDERLFSVIVTMAVVTTMAMPPTLRWALKRLPMREDERERLKREEFEAESQFAQVERVLLAADNSRSGALAAALAGYLGGARNMPVTVLDATAREISDKDDEQENAPSAELATTLAEAVREAAGRAAQTRPEDKKDAPTADIHIGTRKPTAAIGETLAEEAARGHDLLMLGIEPTTASDGGYSLRVADMVDAFKGTCALVSRRGHESVAPSESPRLLVPVTGNVSSTRAAEFAFILARATGADVALLYVRDGATQRRRARLTDAGAAHVPVFRKLRQIASLFDLKLSTMVHESISPETAILREARRGRYNLIVLGVDRRTGETLSFGAIADVLLETSDRSLVFVAGAPAGT